MSKKKKIIVIILFILVIGLTILASIGLPLLMSFPGEFLVFFGALISSVLSNYLIQVLALASIIVLVLSACYLLRLMHSVFYSNISERYMAINDVAVHEFIILFSLSLITIVFGVMPMSIIDIISTNVKLLVGAFGG